MDIYSIIPEHQRILIAPLNWGLAMQHVAFPSSVLSDNSVMKSSLPLTEDH